MASFFKEHGDFFLEHPPYSPDIAPFDFFLFPCLKKNLASRKYTSRQKDWIKILKLCISVKGEYFEGLK